MQQWEVRHGRCSADGATLVTGITARCADGTQQDADARSAPCSMSAGTASSPMSVEGFGADSSMIAGRATDRLGAMLMFAGLPAAGDPLPQEELQALGVASTSRSLGCPGGQLATGFTAVRGPSRLLAVNVASEQRQALGAPPSPYPQAAPNPRPPPPSLPSTPSPVPPGSPEPPAPPLPPTTALSSERSSLVST